MISKSVRRANDERLVIPWITGLFLFFFAFGCSRKQTDLDDADTFIWSAQDGVPTNIAFMTSSAGTAEMRLQIGVSDI